MIFKNVNVCKKQEKGRSLIRPFISLIFHKRFCHFVGAVAVVCVQECAEQIDVVSAFDGAIAISAFFFGEYDYNGVGLKVVGETIGFVPIGASKSPNSDLLAFLILKDAI